MERTCVDISFRQNLGFWKEVLETQESGRKSNRPWEENRAKMLANAQIVLQRTESGPTFRTTEDIEDSDAAGGGGSLQGRKGEKGLVC